MLIANYGATKAYNQLLAEGLWEALACVAGAIATPSVAASGARSQGAADATTLKSEAVVRETLAALGSGPLATPGAGVKAAAFVMRRLLPRAFAIRTMGAVMRRMYRDEPDADA